MVISSKLSDVGGLEFIVSDDTDTDDVGGFSDSIQTVGAKTAKFSGGATMQANSGLRIGMSQLKINTGNATPGIRTEVAVDFVGWAANGSTVDNSETTFVTVANTSGVAVIDYGSVATRDIKLVTRLSGFRQTFTSTDISLNYQISDDNITYTDPVTSSSQFQFLSLPSGGTTLVDTGIVAYDDPNSQSFRYVKITATTTLGQSPVSLWYIYQVTESSLTNQITVRVLSSTTIDTANGTILISDQIMNPSEQLVFDTQLLLTGNPTGDFVTVEIVSLTNLDIPVTLSEITSIKEV